MITANVIFVFICLLPTSIEGLLCVAGVIKSFDLHQFNFDRFQETINSLKTEEWGNGDTCQTHLFKVNTQVTVNFGYAVESDPSLKDEEIYFDVWVRIQKDYRGFRLCKSCIYRQDLELIPFADNRLCFSSIRRPNSRSEM